MMFVFLHEAAHSLLAADEIARTLQLIADQEAMALQAAK
jgi:hypothetical protein